MAQAVGLACAAHDKMVDMLQKKYQESRQAIAVAPRGYVELFVSDAGTWSMLHTNVRGVSCVIAAGEGWETIKAQIKGPDV